MIEISDVEVEQARLDLKQSLLTTSYETAPLSRPAMIYAITNRLLMDEENRHRAVIAALARKLAKEMISFELGNDGKVEA